MVSVCPSSRAPSPIPWYRRIILVPIRYFQKLRSRKSEEKEQENGKDKPPKEVNKLDNIARIMFPLSFVSVMSTYAILYTYYIHDKEPDDESILGFTKVD
ncbi:Hypothetical protein NTJ_12157 [Nesidiocoris tenuis]|nr:Hypothetical protein NTJ_12157 [Nesidiocoris tenuis]